VTFLLKDRTDYLDNVQLREIWKHADTKLEVFKWLNFLCHVALLLLHQRQQCMHVPSRLQTRKQRLSTLQP